VHCDLRSREKAQTAFQEAEALNPDSKIIIVGCYSELSPEELMVLGADEVVGVKEKRAIHKYVASS
jgi:threonylcarbamoyladenosine tRNA methylthiotransferase MtaB